MTEIITMESLEENEDGSIDVKLTYSQSGHDMLVEKGFLLITMCGIYGLDSSQILEAVNIGAAEIKRRRELEQALTDTPE
jgi:hypothetical protein